MLTPLLLPPSKHTLPARSKPSIMHAKQRFCLRVVPLFYRHQVQLQPVVVTTERSSGRPGTRAMIGPCPAASSVAETLQIA
jgi:hypothetical protein